MTEEEKEELTPVVIIDEALEHLNAQAWKMGNWGDLDTFSSSDDDVKDIIAEAIEMDYKPLYKQIHDLGRDKTRKLAGTGHLKSCTVQAIIIARVLNNGALFEGATARLATDLGEKEAESLAGRVPGDSYMRDYLADNDEVFRRTIVGIAYVLSELTGGEHGLRTSIEDAPHAMSTVTSWNDDDANVRDEDGNWISGYAAVEHLLVETRKRFVNDPDFISS